MILAGFSEWFYHERVCVCTLSQTWNVRIQWYSRNRVHNVRVSSCIWMYRWLRCGSMNSFFAICSVRSYLAWASAGGSLPKHTYIYIHKFGGYSIIWQQTARSKLLLLLLLLCRFIPDAQWCACQFTTWRCVTQMMMVLLFRDQESEPKFYKQQTDANSYNTFVCDRFEIHQHELRAHTFAYVTGFSTNSV